MHITLFRELAKPKNKHHIQGYECYHGIHVKNPLSRTGSVDLDETLATGHLYVFLPGENLSWNRDDEICLWCSKHLERALQKQGIKSGTKQAQIFLEK